MNRLFTLLAAALPPLFLCACQYEQNTSDFKISETIQTDLTTLQTSRIFFGHQSVGQNIIDGIQDIFNKNPNHTFPILELATTENYPPGYLLHSAVGENTKLLSKCYDFKRIINDQLADKINIALLKFCYIDINKDSEVNELFNEYKNIMDELTINHPDITFIHVTVPVRYTASGFGVWIREVLGRPNNSKLENIKRNEFNALILETYKNKPIFDLAGSSSTYPDGKRETFIKDGITYNSLIGDYTNDGGHLNEKGRVKVAQDFIQELAAIIKNNTHQ